MSENPFGPQAREYAQFRPDYPDSLYEFLASLVSRRELAWDCATGSGQAAVPLAARFRKVIATDASAEQVAHGVAHPGVEYRVAPAEHTDLESQSADLISVAQAIHWFDLPRFLDEVRRVGRPGGVLAVWGYAFFKTESPLFELLDEYGWKTLGPYWSPKVRLLQEGYRDLHLPFSPVAAPEFSFHKDWSLGELKGYLGSWSSAKAYQDRHGNDPLLLVEADLDRLWGPPERTVRFDWNLSLKVGRL